MNYKNILVTGGAGFVGSNICIRLKEHYPNINVTALDNLIRKGSQLNVPRLKKYGVSFIKGDVRYKKDLAIKGIDFIIECSAEPSVMSGITSSPEYVLETNLIGAVNCFELARKTGSDVIFLSTSRVYPVELLNSLKYKEEAARFTLEGRQEIEGASDKGVEETFPLNGSRTFYGATKLSAELILAEYVENYGMKGAINRFGVIGGRWQMGKVDQGVVAYWMLQHVFGKQLKYIGFGGEGKQVRDILDIDDVFSLLDLQINNMSKFNGNTYNAGGGLKNSLSLKELTGYCQRLTGNTVPIEQVLEERAGDVRIYITDNSKITSETGWAPTKSVSQTLEKVYKWIVENKEELKDVFA